MILRIDSRRGKLESLRMYNNPINVSVSPRICYTRRSGRVNRRLEMEHATYSSGRWVK